MHATTTEREHRLGPVDAIDVRLGMGVREPNRHVRGTTTEVDRTEGLALPLREARHELVDEPLVGLGEVGLAVGLGLLRVVHELGLGDAGPQLHRIRLEAPRTGPPALGPRLPSRLVPSSSFRGWPAGALAFYRGLEADNSKAYWTAHKAIYDDEVRRPMTELCAELEGTYGAFHMFRPNRDVRFSRDKSPYKTAIGAVTEGRGGEAYYVQAVGRGAVRRVRLLPHGFGPTGAIP